MFLSIFTCCCTYYSIIWISNDHDSYDLDSIMILEVHALSRTLYNTITNHSIQYSSLISLLHSLYSHRSDNSIVSATQNLCRHQRRIKTYIRGIITPYVSSTVILFHLQRAGLVRYSCRHTHTSRILSDLTDAFPP